MRKKYLVDIKELKKRCNILLIYVIVLLLCFFVYNPLFKIVHTTGCSLYPISKYNSIDIILSSDFVNNYQIGDIVQYKTSKETLNYKYIEHQIIDICNKGEWYQISGTSWEDGRYECKSQKGQKICDNWYTISECVSPAQIYGKRIFSLIQWGSCN